MNIEIKSIKNKFTCHILRHCLYYQVAANIYYQIIYCTSPWHLCTCDIFNFASIFLPVPYVCNCSVQVVSNNEGGFCNAVKNTYDIKNRSKIGMSILGNTIDTTNTIPLYQHTISLPTFCFLPLFHSSGVTQINFDILYKKKNKKNLKRWVDILFHFILFQIRSNQINDIKLLWEKIIRMALVQWNGVAINSTTQREEKRTETTAQRKGIMIRIVTPTTYDKYVHVLTGVLL